MKKTKFDSRIQEIAMTLNDLMLRERERVRNCWKYRRGSYKLYINKLHCNENLNLLYKNSVI